MGKESTLEALCKQLADLMGWVWYKGFGRNGAPDGIFMKQGRGFTVEFKAPCKKQRPDQVNEEQYLIERGVPYYLCDNLDHFKEIILEQENSI